MGLCGKIDNTINSISLKDIMDGIRITDISLYETEPLFLACRDVFQVFPVTRIGEDIKSGDFIRGMAGKPVVHKIAPDKSRCTGDQQPHAILLSPSGTARWRPAMKEVRTRGFQEYRNCPGQNMRVVEPGF